MDFTLSSLQQLTYRLQHCNLNNQQNISREPGIFQTTLMSWQLNQQSLFQFKEIYSNRLQSLKKAFNLQSNKTIEDLSNNQRVGQLIGLFKRIQSKRVRAFEPEYQEKYQNHKPVFSQNDTYQLEDQTGKVKLEIKNSTKINGVAKFNPIQTPYGVIIKCRGQYSPRINRFILTNIQTPKPAPQQPMIHYKNLMKSLIVMCQPTIQQIITMRDFIRCSSTQQNLYFNELIIIGGVNYGNIEQIRRFDVLMYEIGALIDVFVVPCSSQQNSYLYPRNPLHKSFLQKSYNHKNVSNCSNPQLLVSKNQNVRINTLLSCGQNLLNLKANCNIQDDLELMKLIIQYRHICPSSVFSLPIQSYNYDPLILPQTPHLMIHGKCEMFGSQFWQRQNDMNSIQIRLVALSKGDIANINLSSNVLETKQWQADFFKTQT